MTTVLALGAATDLNGSAKNAQTLEALVRSRFSVTATSCAVSGAPSENSRCGRSLKVQVSLSAEVAALCARPGSGLDSVPYRNSYRPSPHSPIALISWTL